MRAFFCVFENISFRFVTALVIKRLWSLIRR